MNYSDDTLMAFADGALDEHATRELELAVQADPALAAIVARHRALRANVFAAFAPVLDEAVPARLADAASAASAANGAKVAAPPGMGTPLTATKPRWSWPEWGGMAAMLVLGLSLGRLHGLGEQEGLLAPAGKDGVLAQAGNDGVLVQAGSARRAGPGAVAATCRRTACRRSHPHRRQLCGHGWPLLPQLCHGRLSRPRLQARPTVANRRPGRRHRR